MPLCKSPPPVVPTTPLHQPKITTTDNFTSMKAWGAALDPTSKTNVCFNHLTFSPQWHCISKADPQIQIRFLGDPSGQFTKDLDLTFDSAAVFGNDRSKRYALVVEDGKVKSAHVEPDNTGVNGTQFLS